MMAAFSPTLRRNVRLYYAFGFLMEFALWAGIWIKYLIEDRGFELKYLLAMDFPFWLLVAILQAPTGALADHIGRKRVLAIAGVLYALTILGFGFASNYWMLFFDYVLWAFAQSMRSGADSALLYDSLKQENQEGHFQRIAGRGFAISLIAGVLSIGLGGTVANTIGLARVVQVSAVVPLFAMAAALLFDEPRVAHEERHYWAGLKAGISFAWDHPQVRYTLMAGSVLLAGTFAPVVLVQPFFIHHAVGTGLYGWLQAPLRLISVLAAIAAVRVARRLGVGGIMASAAVAIVAAYAGLAVFDATGAFIFFALPALMQGLTRPIIDGYLNDRISSERRATVLSVMQLLFALQVMLFEPTLGFFTDDYSIRVAFLFALGYFVVLMPPLLLLWRRAQSGRGAVPLDAAMEAAG
jgi:MFS family permease